MKRVFTFGSGQRYAGHYVVFEDVKSPAEAREKMNQLYGREWAFEYRDEEEAGVEKYGLKRLFFGMR